MTFISKIEYAVSQMITKESKPQEFKVKCFSRIGLSMLRKISKHLTPSYKHQDELELSMILDASKKLMAFDL